MPAFIPEGAVGDPLEQLSVMVEIAHVTPGDLVRADVEVVVAQGLQPGQHGVNFGFFGCEGVDGGGFPAHGVLLRRC